MAVDLKSQFLLLQEQQKKKLMRRNKLKSEGSSKNEATKEEKSDKNLGLFGLGEAEMNDDLDLKVGLCDNAMDSEEIEDMEETIRELRDENGRLYKLLGEKSEEMKILKRRWQDEKKELTGQNIGSENVAQKIIELSKKNRDLTSEVESWKTRQRQSQNEMQKLENELKRTTSKQKVDAQLKSQDNETKQESKTAELEAKVAQLNAKVMEYRNQVDTQKKELKIAQKVLAKEVGDGVNIQSLLNSESNWRGRQQTIINLQKKLADLQQSVPSLASPTRQSRFSSNSMMSSMSYQSPLAATMNDEKIRSTIKKIEMERKETQQKLQNDLESLQTEHSKLKGKHDAAKSRNQVLAQELKNIKSQVATLIEKGKHDDDLVAALMREQEYLKNINQQLVKEKDNYISNNRTVKANHDLQINSELKKQVEEQEKKVKELEDEVQSLKDSKSQEKRNENRLNTANSTKSNGQLKQKAINRPSLIPTPPTSAERQRNGYRFRRGSSAGEDMLTLRTQLQEAKSVLQASDVERDRLLELVKVLQNRIGEATDNCLAAENKTIELKRMNVKFEKQIERLKSNGNNKSQQHVIHGKTRPVSRSRNGGHQREKSIEETYEEIEELKTRLEIQADENDALKEALNSTLQAKYDDVKLYQEMVEQTKQIFIQGMKQFKQTAS
eukprot:gene3006-3464_t